MLIVLIVLIIIGTRPKHAGLAKAGPQILPTAPTAATGAATVEKPVQKIANSTGIKGVIAYNTTGWPGNGTTPTGALPHNHVTGPITYSVLPPAGGDHNPIWMNAGVYTAPVPSERAVHDLEHGAIWITYRPGLPTSEVQAIEKFAGDQSLIDESGNNANRFMLVSPWADKSLPAPIVLSAWGYQLYVTSPTDPRMQQFVNMFRHSQKYSPEYGSAVDGVPINAGSGANQLGGGQPALYGSKYANPAHY
ncbi:MAG: DUF3105 domain-containing protein [Marmoricola sp.]